MGRLLDMRRLGSETIGLEDSPFLNLVKINILKFQSFEKKKS
jgi:hypothetical protein